MLELPKAYPVGADALGPCSQDHGLDGSACIRDPIWTVLGANHNRQRGLRNIGASSCECTKLAQHLLVLYDDEMPGLLVHTTRRQVSCFNDLLDNWFGHRLLLKLANSQDSANRVKYLHNVPLCLNSALLFLWEIDH